MRITRRIARYAVAGFFIFMGVLSLGVGLAPFPSLDRYEDRSPYMTDRDGHVLNIGLSDDEKWRMATVPNAVDPLYLSMLVAVEDQRFYIHPGVDPLAVLRAMGQDIAAGRVVSGASTLTMQAVRLLEPKPRNWTSKLTEMAQAVRLDWRYGKFGVLSIHLTLAPFGGNIEGVEAASHAYFGHSATNLSVAEAALLVALPQSPENLRPDRHPQQARQARDHVLARALSRGVITASDYAEALTVPISQHKYPRPNLAPHLFARLAQTDQPRISTYLQGDLQARVEAWAQRHHARLSDGATLATLIVDNKTREVLVYVGSGDWRDRSRLAYNDMVRAVRSPGSTLKPFIYGQGFDAGIIQPETIIADEPVRFGVYKPQNFDKLFHGEVSVREALQQSLNIPAIIVLDRVGPASFLDSLREAGVRLQLPSGQNRPGLPIAIGGVGTRLEDLTGLYAALADQGRFKPIRIESRNADETGFMIMTPASAWQVTQILQTAPRPDAFQALSEQRPIAYKTGTSYGFRDAWALGYDPNYTIGIWVGRADGSAMPGRVAREVAAPLLFELFTLMPAPSPQQSTAGLYSAPPSGAAFIPNDQLPQALKRLSKASPAIAVLADTSPSPKIIFPPNNATIEYDPVDESHIVIKSEGGRLPLIWTIDGEVQNDTGYQRRLTWKPSGFGQSLVQVTDRDGYSDHIFVWLQKP